MYPASHKERRMAKTKNNPTTSNHKTFSRHPQEKVLLNKFLDNFYNNLASGYGNGDGWVWAARIYNELCNHLEPRDREILGTAWRETYTFYDQNVLLRAVERVRNSVNA